MYSKSLLNICKYTSLEKLKTMINQINYKEYLEFAASINRLDLVKYITELNLYYYDALLIACVTNSIETVEYLLTEAPYYYQSFYHGRSCLAYACFHSSFKTVKFLIEQKKFNFEICDHSPLKSCTENYMRDNIDIRLVLYLKNLYIKKYQNKFICYNCIALPICTKLCSEDIIKR